MYRMKCHNGEMICAVAVLSLLICLQWSAPAKADQNQFPRSQNTPEIAVPPAAVPGNTPGESRNLEVIKPSTVNEAELEHNPSFETLRDYALAHNPSVSEALSAWRAASAQVVTASSWENPMVSYSPDTQNMVETKNGMQTNAVGVSQAIPFPGKLTLRGKIANQQALAAHARVEAVIQEVTRQVRRRFADYYLADRSLEVNAATTDLLRQFQAIAQAMYRVGTAPEQDVIQAQEELSRLAAQTVDLQSRRKAVLGALNALLDRPPRAPLGRPVKLAAITTDAALDARIAEASRNRPELRAQDHVVEGSRRALTLARMGYLPDFTFGGEYIGIQNSPAPGGRMGNGHDVWMATVGLSVPIWVNRVKAGIDRAQAEVLEQGFKRRDLGNAVGDQVQDAYERLTASEREEKIYASTLIPQTLERVKAARAEYQTGIVNFLTLIDSLRSFEQVRLLRYQSIAQSQQAGADLERAVGQAITGISK